MFPQNKYLNWIYQIILCDLSNTIHHSFKEFKVMINEKYKEIIILVFLSAIAISYYTIYIIRAIFQEKKLIIFTARLNLSSQIKRICWIFDKRIAYQVLISLCSIIKNNPHESFVFYFILPPNTNFDLTIFNHFLHPWMKIEIRYFSLKHNVTSLVDFPQRKCPHTTIIIVKFWLPEILPEANRVLYLDSDMINCGKISDLWDIDLKGKSIVATIRVKRRWVNSGFIIYNLDLLRKKNDFINCALRRNSCFLDDYYHTTCHRGSIQILPYRYNVEFVDMLKKDKDNETKKYRLDEENHTVFFHVKDKETHAFYTLKRSQLNKIPYAKKSKRVLNFLQKLYFIREWVDSELLKLNKSILSV